MFSTAIRNASDYADEIGLSELEKANFLKDSQQIVSNADKIFKNSLPILQHGDFNGLNSNITRYAIPVNMNGTRYNVMSTLKNGNLNGLNILYDLKSKPSSLANSVATSNDYKTSIADLEKFVNDNLKNVRAK